jgi:iron complex outermembrane receptor protein
MDNAANDLPRHARKTLLLATAGALLLALPAAAATTGASDGQREEVVVIAKRAVTATKTDTKLTETPQAISVVTAAQFTDRGAVNFQDTLRYSAGVRAESYGLDTRFDGEFVRGFDPVQYLDGMMRLFGYNLIPRADIYTLERVEVLRGPSSVLYGQGSVAGLINLVSKRPTFGAPTGEIAVQYGTYNRKQLQFDVSGALNDAGTLAGRLTGLVRDSDMQTDHVPDDRKMLSPSLSWRPDDDTEITFIGLFQKDKTASSQQFLPVVATLDAAPGRRLPDNRFLGEPDVDRLESQQTAGTLLLNHRFTDAVTLNSRVRYMNARTDFYEIYPDVYSNPDNPFIDANRRVLDRFIYYTKPRVRALTTDNNLQFDFVTGAFTHKLLAGVDYLRFRQESSGASDLTTPIDAYDPVYGNYTVPDASDDPDQRQSQLGFYLQDQIRYAERVSLVLGARRDRATSDVEGSPQQVDHATTYRAGIIVDAGAGFSPYFSYSQSFLPVAGLDFYNQPFKPERGRQYEAGVKWQPDTDTLVTVAAFDILNTNRQTNDPNNVINTVQTGAVVWRGFEIEASRAVAENFYVIAAYSYTNAKVTKSNFAPEVDAQLNDVPKQLASIWGVKTLPLDGGLALRVGAGVRYIGPTYSTGATSVVRTPGYALVDALLGFDWQQWALSINAANLIDRHYYAPCRNFGDCFIGNRRTLIGTLAYRF